MDVTEALWKDQLQRLGDYIKAQRKFNQQSQRDLARLADLSDTYMSQLERGLHEPSIRVLRALAESLGLRPDQLIMSAAGLPLEESELSTENAIRLDPRFTDAQRRALLSVVRSYLEANDP
jgi:transcriptional regulator with XRE-family HTH domain